MALFDLEFSFAYAKFYIRMSFHKSIHPNLVSATTHAPFPDFYEILQVFLAMT